MDSLSFTYFWSLSEEQWLETLLCEEQQNPFPSPLSSAAFFIMEVLSTRLHSCNVTYRCCGTAITTDTMDMWSGGVDKTAVVTVLADLTIVSAPITSAPLNTLQNEVEIIPLNSF